MTALPASAATGRPDIAAIAAALATSGLVLRGGFGFADDDARPPGPGGRPAKSVLLVGQAGASIWPHFSRWREVQVRDLANPLDTWSREMIGAVASRFGAHAVFPFEKPYLPFQQWAMRAEGLRPSPLGILMHPEYGLWHAYRGLRRRFTFATYATENPAYPPVRSAHIRSRVLPMRVASDISGRVTAKPA
jgi:hypothetical protein